MPGNGRLILQQGGNSMRRLLEFLLHPFRFFRQRRCIHQRLDDLRSRIDAERSIQFRK